MSSPEILEVHPLSDESARYRHRKLARHHLDQARAAIARLREELDAISRCGGNPADDLLPIDEAESAVEVLANQADGGAAVVRAEAYLRHVQGAEIRLRKRRAHVEAESAYRNELQEIERREAERLANLASRFAPAELRLCELTREESGAPTRTAQPTASALERIIAVILASACTESEREELANRIDDLASLPARERFLQLDTLQSARELETKTRLLAAAVQIEADRTERALRGFASIALDSLESQIDEMEEVQTGFFGSKLADLRSDAPRLDENALQTRVEDLLSQMGTAQQKERIMRAVVSALRRHGYEAATEMNTLTSGDIQSMFLEDRRDPDRMIHMQCSPDRGLVSAEVVRCKEATGTQRESQLDIESQERLCQALGSVRDTLSPAFSVGVHARIPPGQPLKVQNSATQFRARRRRPATTDRVKSLKQ